MKQLLAPNPTAAENAPKPTRRLDLLREGDEQAWTDAFQQLWPIILKAAGHPSSALTPSEAEEVANDALALLVLRVELVSTMDQLKALAVTIARRRAISVARAKSAAKRGLVPGAHDASREQDSSDEMSVDTPLREVELAEMTLLLKEALDCLDPEIQRLLRGKISEELSYQELSLRYEMPLGTVCTKVARGLRRVRKKLESSPNLLKELRGYLR